jgi:hypothetical protein
MTHPALDFTLLSLPTFRLSMLGGTAARIAVGALPFLLPSFLQLSFGLSAVQSGLVTFAAPIGALASRLGSRRIFRRYGFRRIMMINGCSAGLVFFLISLFRPGAPLPLLTALLMFGGLVQALQFLAYNTIAYADVPPARMSAATSFYATLQQTTLSLGVCTAAAVMAVARAIDHHAASTAGDFSAGFIVTGCISLLAAPLASRLAPSAGAELSEHKPSRGDN